MTDIKLVDSSVWIEYLFNNHFQEIIDSGQVLYLSVLTLFEVYKKLKKEKIEQNKIIISLDFLKKRSLLIPVSAEIAEKAVELSLHHDLPAIDSLIYATAVHQRVHLITCDNDFRGLPEVTVLK